MEVLGPKCNERSSTLNPRSDRHHDKEPDEDERGSAHGENRNEQVGSYQHAKR
jgi:hypothetical protein